MASVLAMWLASEFERIRRALTLGLFWASPGRVLRNLCQIRDSLSTARLTVSYRAEM